MYLEKRKIMRKFGEKETELALMKFGQSWLFQILGLNLQCIDFHGFCANYCYILNCSKHEYCEIAAIGKNAKILIA